AQVGGIWHGRRMLPCPLQISGRHAINTVSLSDGPHTLQSCVTDFAGNRGCTTVNHIKVDNSPPAAPLGMRVVGGDQWRRQDSFDLAWSNPSEGAGSPIVGATYRVTGPDGFDTGSRYEAGQGITEVGGIALPKAGEYRVSLRLRDQAGNSTAANVGRATLRFDDVPPEVGFRGFSDVGMPERIRARIFDSHSGPA